jgi:hypothetical protein
LIVDDEQFESMLVAWAESLTEVEKSEARAVLAKWCADRETKGGSNWTGGGNRGRAQANR